MLVWGSFIGLIIIFLALDLGVFHKHEHVIKSKEAGIWTAIWVTVALSFSGVIYWLFYNNILDNPTGLAPNDAVLKYITGYLIELSLSVDNVFVIAVMDALIFLSAYTFLGTFANSVSFPATIPTTGLNHDSLCPLCRPRFL